MALTVTLGIVFAWYVVATGVLWWRMGLMRDKLHEFAAVVAAFVALFLNASAIADNQERLDRQLQTAAIRAFYDENWNIYLQPVGDTSYVLPTSIKLMPTFYKRGMQPFPTHTGSTVEVHEGDYHNPQPGRSIVIRNAEAILCGRQHDDLCKGMILVDVWAQLGDLAPVPVHRRVPSDEK